MCVKYSKEGTYLLNNSDVYVQAISQCWKVDVTSSFAYGTVLHHVVLNRFVADWTLHKSYVLKVCDQLSTNFFQNFFWAVNYIIIFLKTFNYRFNQFVAFPFDGPNFPPVLFKDMWKFFPIPQLANCPELDKIIILGVHNFYMILNIY